MQYYTFRKNVLSYDDWQKSARWKCQPAASTDICTAFLSVKSMKGQNVPQEKWILEALRSMSVWTVV